jgi:membrane-associated phospholipid phosphatase
MFYVWIIGVNRFRENRHNISDIVAGWFMVSLLSHFGTWFMVSGTMSTDPQTFSAAL